MNLSTSPPVPPLGTTRQEDTTQRSDAYSAGQAATVINATGAQVGRTPIIYCEPPCPEHLCRAFSQQHWCSYSQSAKDL